MSQAKVIQATDANWEPHPLFEGLESAFLLSNLEDNTDLTCMLTLLKSGTKVEKHAHEFDEIIYVLKGKAIMEIEGTGQFPMSAGTFLRIPKGIAHQPCEVEQDLTAYNVFYPYLK